MGRACLPRDTGYAVQHRETLLRAAAWRTDTSRASRGPVLRGVGTGRTRHQARRLVDAGRLYSSGSGTWFGVPSANATVRTYGGSAIEYEYRRCERPLMRARSSSSPPRPFQAAESLRITSGSRPTGAHAVAERHARPEALTPYTLSRRLYTPSFSTDHVPGPLTPEKVRRARERSAAIRADVQRHGVDFSRLPDPVEELVKARDAGCRER